MSNKLVRGRLPLPRGLAKSLPSSGFSLSAFGTVVLECDSRKSVDAPSNLLQSWGDQRGPVYSDATQSTGGLKPTWNASGPNGKPQVDFGGTQYLSTVDDASYRPANITVFLVAKRTGSASFQGYLNCANTGTWSDGWGITGLVAGDTIRFWVNNYIGAGQFVDYSSSDTSWHVLEGVYDGSNVKFLVDGVSKGTSAYVGSIAGGNQLGIGASQSAGSHGTWGLPLTGSIARVVLYNSGLGTSARSSIRQYLGNLYGITVTP